MSIAPTKWSSSCCGRPGHSRFGHLVNTESSGLTVGVSHTGQRSGGFGAGGRSLRSATCGAGESTCGITSPARSTITSSPSRMSLRAKVLLVVERRELDGDAADVNRLEHRVRMKVAELAGVPADSVELRDRGRRRELPGDRPPRLTPDRAEPALELDVVDLHDRAVDLEVERSPLLLPRFAPGHDLFLGAELRHLLCTGKRCARSHSSASQWESNEIPSVAPIA